jgi:dipeptidyl aminopeptidase/acylaminoacyl peptidase
MRSILLAAAAATIICGAAVAKPAEGPARTFQPQDLFALEFASDPQVKPDGSQIAYVRATYSDMTDRARRSIWLVDSASGAQTPLISGPGSAMRPRWSPDGKRLAYVAVEDGKPQLFVRWMSTGESARVAEVPEAPGEIAWSPDGRYLAFTRFVEDEGVKFGAPLKKPEGAKWAEPLKVITKLHYRQDGEGYLRPGFDQVFLVSADGGAPRQLTFGSYDNGGSLSWTPDGRYLAISSNHGKDWERDRQNSEVFLLSIADGTMTPLTSRYGPDGAPRVSPDGTKIAYLSYDDTRKRGYDNVELWVMNRDGSGGRSLTAGLDRSIEDLRWSADGRSVYVQYTDKAVVKVARVGLDGRMTPVVEGLSGGSLDRPYTGGEFTVSDNGVVAFTGSDWTRPADLQVAGKGSPRQLTHLNEDLFMGKTLGRVEHLAVTSAFDKRPVDAWIVMPPNADPSRRYPTILEIHGGPYSSYGPVFSTDDQLYAAAGYAVLYVNPRGSTSYGDEFANLIQNNYPGQDYDDLMSAVDAAIAAGKSDPDNLFVTGGSGGGVLSAWIVGKTHRFKAAAVQKPVIDWTSFAGTTDFYPTVTSHWFAKPPWEDPEPYWKRSPLSLVGNVTTPTMVVVGEEDYRTPVSQSEQYYQALQLRGIETAFVKVPGASHGGFTSRPSQSAAKALAILAWFDKHRTDRGAATGGGGQ